MRVKLVMPAEFSKPTKVPKVSTLAERLKLVVPSAAVTLATVVPGSLTSRNPKSVTGVLNAIVSG